jgi:hypothetical protein
MGIGVTRAAYLTEQEIIRELRLPDRVGKAMLAQWKLHPSFPQPIAGMSGRRFMPSVEQWLFRYHGVNNSAEAGPVIPAAAGEKFDEWRKARKARRPRHTGPDLPPPPVRMAPNVVAAIGPRGKRLPQDDVSPLAPVGGKPTSD